MRKTSVSKDLEKLFVWSINMDLGLCYGYKLAEKELYSSPFPFLVIVSMPVTVEQAIP